MAISEFGCYTDIPKLGKRLV